MKTFKYIWSIICYPLLYIGVQLVISIIYAIAATIFSIIKNPGLSAETLASTIKIDIQIPLVLSLFITALIIFLIKRKEWKFEKFLKADDSLLLLLPICFILGIVMNFFISGLLSLIDVYKFFPDYEKMMENVFSGNFILQVINVGLLAPLVEEFIFRGIILKSLSKKLSVFLAVLIQALIFGIIHLNVLQGLYAFILGIFLGFVYIWSESIWAAAAVHITFNMTPVVLSKIIEGMETSTEAAETGIPALIVTTLVGFSISCAMLFAIYAIRRGKRKNLY